MTPMRVAAVPPSRRSPPPPPLLLLTFLALLPIPAASASAGGSRDVVSFDFGWKHRTGLTDRSPPDEEPPVDTDPGLRPPESDPTYDDGPWSDVTLPHDGLIGGAPSEKACPQGCSGNSYIPRHVLWYRKSFVLPPEWERDGGPSSVWLEFDGSFRNTTVWVNGARASNHVCGYTPFRVRIDDIAGVGFGSRTVVAVFVDPDNGDKGRRDRGSGWWYEGGGLYRSVRLVRTNSIRVDWDGMFARSDVTMTIAGDGGGASSAPDAAALTASVTVRNDDTAAGAGRDACVVLDARGPDGSVAAATDVTRVAIPPGGSATIAGVMRVESPKLWTASSPSLYSVSAAVSDCRGNLLDSVSVPHGVRAIRYDADGGFFLNEERFKVRGFCDHDNFAVVGMAVPDRINLFRAQASRSIGGNGRRTSHNPPDPAVLDIYDRLGMVVMDENRLFDDNPEYAENMGALVRRDRNHPSVVIWSFCNEGDCEGKNQKGGPAFKAITYKYDGTRPTLANMFTFGDLLSNLIDVQGFSHQSREQLDRCHSALPRKPIYMSECCSCNTMRSEDVGCETTHDNPHNPCIQESFNARCLESNNAVNASDGAEYAVGTMVWTLFDYYGEPPVGGFEVSSTYGQFDLCGFPKAAAFWFRTQWLLSIPDGRSDKTFPTNGRYEVQIVESWESPDSWNETRGNKTRVVHAYSNAPFIELKVNGKSQGSRTVVPMARGPGSYAEWLSVPWEPGVLTAVARNQKGAELATAERRTNGRAARLALTVDSPSDATGTGSALFLDGQDAALVRATVVDGWGRAMHVAKNNVTFAVIGGPGYVQGTGNGDPHCREPNDAPWRSAYHGLARAVVRVTSVAGRSPYERAALRAIDLDGPMSAVGQRDPPALNDGDIVVEATSPGFEAVRVTIPTTADPSGSVLSVAEAAAGKSVDFFGDPRGRDGGGGLAVE